MVGKCKMELAVRRFQNKSVSWDMRDRLRFIDHCVGRNGWQFALFSCI